MELDWLLRKHRDLIIIGVHMMGDLAEVEKVERMMELHPNLWLDTAVINQRPVWQDLSRERIERIRRLMIRYADRILFGSDAILAGVRDAQGARRIGERYAAIRRLLEGDQLFPWGGGQRPGLNLPEDVLRKIYYQNAVRLLGDRVLGKKGLPVPQEQLLEHCRYLIGLPELPQARVELQALYDEITSTPR